MPVGAEVIIIQAMAPPATALSWFLDKVLGTLLAGILVAFIGSYLFARVNERFRARRDQYSRTVDTLREHLQKIVEVGSGYWGTKSSPSKDAASYGELVYRVQEIHGHVRYCGGPLWKPDGTLVDLVAALTYEALRPTKRPDAARAEKIANSASALSLELAQARMSYFSTEGVGAIILRRAKIISSHPVTRWAVIVFLIALVTAGAA